MGQRYTTKEHEGVRSLGVNSAGKLFIGDELSWADMCLDPMLQEAQRLPWEPGVLLGAAPTIFRSMKVLGTIDAFWTGALQFNAKP